METYLALLRGINVSGHNMIGMDALKKALEDLGLSNISTYIQSGNVVFDYRETSPMQLAKIISDTISDKSGLSVPVIIRKRPEMEDICSSNPFLKPGNENTSHLHVSLLAEHPEERLVKGIGEVKHIPDEFIIFGKTIYLYCPGGYGRTKLNNAFFERKLKTLVTTRNWKTIVRLTGMMNHS